MLMPFDKFDKFIDNFIRLFISKLIRIDKFIRIYF